MQAWEARYRCGETGWDRGAPSPALMHWLEQMEPCRILVPGCGRGYEVVELAKRGFAVTAIDIAPSAIAALKSFLAREQVHARVIQADLFTHVAEPGYDMLYEQTCLCALEPERRQAYAHLCRDWLRPGGRMFALFMQTGMPGGPPYHCDLLEMRQLFGESNWLWPDELPLFVPQRSGRFELGYVLTRI
ncbi:MAG: methyltransferase domain-containing protein [Zetaproteobacteria bacterium]|nr:MAG: methyltransferase domain-containing protein [Zetaproteobacteria bacterium]